MIRNVKKWEAWQREYARNKPLDVEHNFRVFQALWDHAHALGKVPRKDPLEGLELKIRVARDFRRAYKLDSENLDGP
jgi:hypothetical protein